MSKIRIKKFKKFFSRAIPLWMALLIGLNASMIVGFSEYYVMKQKLNDTLVKLAKATQDPKELVQILKQEVLPAKGYTTMVTWGDIGQKLVEVGAIDKEKYNELFANDPNSKDSLKFLSGNWKHKMVINESNSRFMVNTLWALGLVNKSKVLDEGPMRTGGYETGKYASTAGWTLGSKEAMELYSSKELIPLTEEQQELVKKIAQNVYRPCCGNSTYFPDCNHGMAALGYIQLAVKQGVPEKQIYKDLLAFNSFWFPQTYIEMAVYFDKQGTPWKNVDPKLSLSADYSSAQGAQRIRQSVQNVPGLNVGGGGCGV